MRLSRVDNDNDWTFGRGKANYLRQSAAIKQHVKTRLQSFDKDWVHNISHGIDWINLLGNLGTERRILRAVERTVLKTDGVVTVGTLQIVRRDKDRGIDIEYSYRDVFNETIIDKFGITI